MMVAFGPEVKYEDFLLTVRGSNKKKSKVPVHNMEVCKERRYSSTHS
jgi:hypothetical protein